MPRFHLARADMLRRTGQIEQAREAFGLALDLTQNAVERDFIAGRIASLADGQFGGQLSVNGEQSD
jgi:predicted RNA polymerase sigma factor